MIEHNQWPTEITKVNSHEERRRGVVVYGGRKHGSELQIKPKRKEDHSSAHNTYDIDEQWRDGDYGGRILTPPSLKVVNGSER